MASSYLGCGAWQPPLSRPKKGGSPGGLGVELGLPVASGELLGFNLSPSQRPEMKSSVSGSRIRRSRAIIGIVVFVLTASACGPTRQSTIEIRHGPRTVHLQEHEVGSERPARVREVASGNELRIPNPFDASIRVSGTNSALYACTLSQTPISVPEIEQTRQFLAALGQYLPDFGGVFAALAPPDSTRVSRNAAAVREALHGLRTAVDSMRLARMQTLATLDTMRDDAKDVEQTAQELRDRLCGEGCEKVQTLSFVPQTINALDLLARSRPGLEADLRPLDVNCPPDSDKAECILLRQADGMLDLADQLTASAYDVESLARTVGNAAATVQCGMVDAGLDRGQAVVVRVAPRERAELRRIASRPPLEFKASVLPRLAVTPAVGVALLIAPGAKFPKFGTLALRNPQGAKRADSVTIRESGEQESTISYGLSLGAAIPLMNDVRLHVPEFTLNPIADQRALALGAGVSWKGFKVGAGGMWTRHPRLVGQSVGEILVDPALLRSDEGYGSLRDADLYVSLSISGWPPFVGTK